jgi:hypothetical protein
MKKQMMCVSFHIYAFLNIEKYIIILKINYIKLQNMYIVNKSLHQKHGLITRYFFDYVSNLII